MNPVVPAALETVRQMQAAAWANKTVKGFNTVDVALEFGLLHGELAEAFDAWRRDQVPLMAVELADVAIYLFGLAEMVGVDLQDEIAFKLAVNANRRYRRDPASGTLVKDPAGQTADTAGCPECGSRDRQIRKALEDDYCEHLWHDGDSPGGDAR